VVEAHELQRALDDGLAVVSEWDSVEDRLRAAGLDPEAVQEVIGARFEAHVEHPDWREFFALPGAVECFCAGFAEGLLAGKML
jgi:hypothetical protein